MKKLTRVYDGERSLKNLKRIKKYFINIEIRVNISMYKIHLKIVEILDRGSFDQNSLD
jgi:hypothetical protein